MATGDVIVVRYADDLVVGFENRTEAERFLSGDLFIGAEPYMHLFPLKKAYGVLEAQGLLTEAQRIRASPDRFGVFRSAMMVGLLQRKALLDKFVADWLPNGSFPEGRRLLNAFARIYERWKKLKEAHAA